MSCLGLAFAGILTDLGLDGSASVAALLTFTIGVELARLLTVALVFPSLYVASRTRWYPALRLSGAAVAPAAATGWALDRPGVLANPLSGAEDAVIAHPWWVIAGLAAVAAACWAADRRPQSCPVGGAPEEVLTAGRGTGGGPADLFVEVDDWAAFSRMAGPGRVLDRDRHAIAQWRERLPSVRRFWEVVDRRGIEAALGDGPVPGPGDRSPERTS